MISVVVITKNAEHSIRQCLMSVSRITDDIVVVDSGSTDETEEIVRSFAAARFIHQDWLGFGPQKAFAAMQAKHDWILSLDADEWLSDELESSIKSLDLNNAQHDGVFTLKRQNKFMGRFLKHGAGYPDKVVRIFNRRHSNWSEDLVHEKITFTGSNKVLNGPLLHDSCETLSKFIAKQNSYTDVQSTEKSSSTKLLLSPIVRFSKEYFFKLGLLDGVPGLVFAATNAYFAFIKHAKRIR